MQIVNKSVLLIISFILFPIILFAQIPSGAIAFYSLDNNAIDTSSNSYNGTLSLTSATTNRFNISNSATNFTAGSSTGVLPGTLVVGVKDDFTICFWFRTTMVASTSDQWYGGKALIDAEVCGGTTDWGTALIDGGKVCFGIGAPDITIKSISAGYNDGNWHFVTATRNKLSGTIILYIDGLMVNSSSATNTNSSIAPNSVHLGSNPCVPMGVYTGDLDDLFFYNRVLSSAEILNMYMFMNPVVLPLRWISFNGNLQGNDAKLQWQVESVENNDHFEIEYSTDGINFIKKGTLQNEDGRSTEFTERKIYSFSDDNLASGLHFYRIRQIDKDGMFTLSKTIQLKVNFKMAGFYLRSNPVAEQLILQNINGAEVLQLQVVDISGRILLNRMISSTDEVIKTEVGKLQPGKYILRIISNNKQVTIPWIKQ